MQLHFTPRCFAISLLTLLCLGAPALDLDACSCSLNVRPCEQLGWADAVFAGTVLDVKSYEDMSGNRAHIQVEEAFRGMDGFVGKTIVVDGASTFCAYSFDKGKRYLIYARGVPAGGLLRTHSCDGTQPVEEASQDLAFLRSLPTAPALGSIYGQAKVWQFPRGLSRVWIIVRGQGIERKAVTNERGEYEAKDLPAGTYTIRAVIPGQLRSDRSTVTVTKHVCTNIDFAVKGDSLVRFPPPE